MLLVSTGIRSNESGSPPTGYERFPADGMDNLLRREVRASYFEFGLVNLLFSRGAEKQFGGINANSRDRLA